MSPTPAPFAPTPESLPRISMVTPSYNQVDYLEATLRSVLEQGYPNLEYLVVDGGSTDGSVEILRRYADRLAWWVSEPDGGHGDALDKGFARATGEVMGWINSDDLLLPGSLLLVGRLFAQFPEIEWLTSPGAVLDTAGSIVETLRPTRWTREQFLVRRLRFIQQESTFWRRSLWERAGAHVSAEHLACDHELWARFFRHAEPHLTRGLIGAFRHRPEQASVKRRERYLAEVRATLGRESEVPAAGIQKRAGAGEIRFDAELDRFTISRFGGSALSYDLPAVVRAFVAIDDALAERLSLVEFDAPSSGFEAHPAIRDAFPVLTRRRQRDFLFVWLGSGEAQGVHVELSCSEVVPVELRILVAPGPSRLDRRRTLRVVLESSGGRLHVSEHGFDGEREIVCRLDLPPGLVHVALSIAEEATIAVLPNGDTRPLLAALADLRLLAAR